MFSIQNLSRWRRREWVLAIAALLVVTIGPLAWIQWRQFQMLEDLSTNQVDSIMWQAYQLERELGRLDQVVHNAELSPGSADPYELQERYEIFISRIDLLRKIPRRDLLERSEVYTQALTELEKFVTYADPLFAKPDELAQSPAVLSDMDRRIEQLTPLLGDVTRESNRAVAVFVDERNQQLQQQSMLVIGMASVQSVVMLLFVGLLIRHIRRQQQQYTRLQKLSKELTEARDQAEAANHGKSVFLANMSHEIRTPFQGLLGMLNLLGDASLSNQQRDYLQTARDSALHLLGVLNDILDVTTMESGTLKLSTAPTHLRTVVDEVDNLMRVSAEDKGLQFHIYAAANLPEWVMADATRLRQIMYNLINNAIKFTHEGSIMVEVARSDAMPDGVVITVRDTGVGMDAETVERLFTRFFQADNSLRRRIGGAGLGLEISRNLARMMGGDIHVSSQAGVGSVFTVILQLPHCDAPASDTGTGSGSLGAPRRLKILVAEDHPINLKYMNILLEKMGHDATFCENGQEALELVQRNSYDVVLLDYHMPVLDGLAATEAIRALPGPASETKIILVTADVVNDTRKRALEVGINEFASKPLQAEDLKRALARCGLLEPQAGAQAIPGEDAGGSSGIPLDSRPFTLSTYEMPVILPTPEMSAQVLIDPEAYGEIVSMMPEDSLEEMLDTLFRPPEGTVPVLLQNIADGDRKTIGHNAHKLKGTSMLMGFKALVDTSARIEYLATQTEEPIGQEYAEQLRREAEATRDAVRVFEAKA
ncbi:ATP-binding protein [Hydrogenophaga sp.]|uniref:ATP-binding protein n=1 Tax=Hydrogenophaga sp. TaxID=1904254 RepID=UPI0035AFC065